MLFLLLSLLAVNPKQPVKRYKRVLVSSECRSGWNAGWHRCSFPLCQNVVWRTPTKRLQKPGAEDIHHEVFSCDPELVSEFDKEWKLLPQRWDSNRRCKVLVNQGYTASKRQTHTFQVFIFLLFICDTVCLNLKLQSSNKCGFSVSCGHYFDFPGQMPDHHLALE